MPLQSPFFHTEPKNYTAMLETYSGDRKKLWEKKKKKKDKQKNHFLYQFRFLIAVKTSVQVFLAINS